MKHVGSLDIRKDLRVRGRVENNLHVENKVQAAGFYLNPGVNGIGRSLNEDILSFDIPTAIVDSYFFESFVDQGFIIDDRAQANSLWIGFVGRTEGQNDEDFTTSGGHTLQVQHVAGIVTLAASTAIGAVGGLSAHTTISGREFIDAEAGGGRRLASIIIDPV